MSAGCHRLLRDGATCVTDAAEVIELVGPVGFLDLDLSGARRLRWQRARRTVAARTAGPGRRPAPTARPVPPRWPEQGRGCRGPGAGGTGSPARRVGWPRWRVGRWRRDGDARRVGRPWRRVGTSVGRWATVPGPARGLRRRPGAEQGRSCTPTCLAVRRPRPPGLASRWPGPGRRRTLPGDIAGRLDSPRPGARSVGARPGALEGVAVATDEPAGLARTTTARRAAGARAFTRWLGRTGRAGGRRDRLRSPKAHARCLGCSGRTRREPSLTAAADRAGRCPEPGEEAADRRPRPGECPGRAGDGRPGSGHAGAALRDRDPGRGAAGLDLTDLDLGRRTVRVMGKGAKERVVPFGVPAARAAGTGWPGTGGLARPKPEALPCSSVSEDGASISVRCVRRPRAGRRRARGGRDRASRTTPFGCNSSSRRRRRPS